MNLFDRINNKINLLNKYYGEELFPIQNKLGDLLERASNARYTREELENIIFSDNDVLDNQEIISQDSDLWEAVRDIQHDIVDTFSDLTE